MCVLKPSFVDEYERLFLLHHDDQVLGEYLPFLHIDFAVYISANWAQESPSEPQADQSESKAALLLTNTQLL